MKVTIRQKFVDKVTKQLYRPGDVVEMTEERVAEIRKTLPKAIEAPKAAKAEKAEKTKKAKAKKD